jgi:predicted RNase H-like HicB family nuclease
MASSPRDGRPDHEDEIRMWREDDTWVITDVETGVTTQGETREEALEMLDEAVALYRGEAGEPIDTPEDEREALEKLGIDPDEVEAAREENTELPDFMQ